MAEATQASRQATTDMVVSSMRSTSSVKRKPPMGALKMPAIPAPAPQPSSIMVMWESMRKRRATLLPMAAPV